jgi:endonuclease/exonuclease/phosphatase (EEP) superfamily protein YafD
MQGGQHQVPGFGGRNSRGNGFQIAHLSHQDHVGVFAHRGPQGRGKRKGILTNFPLVDQAAAVTVNVLDGIFEGNDVQPGLCI